jgi:tight adherence protein B
VKFLLAADHLSTGASLSPATVAVRAGTVTLPVKVEQVSTTELGASSRAVVVVIDSSGSMKGAPLAAAQAAAREYVRTMPADVQIGLVAFADTPRTLLAPTTDRASYAAAVGRLAADGETAVYDAVAMATDLLGKYSERRILLLSDGADNGSTTTPKQLGRALSRGGAMLDVVTFGAAAPDAELGPLADGTGGGLAVATNAAALTMAFRSAASVFTAPVLVTAQVPAALAGRTEQLTVDVTIAGRRITAVEPVKFAVDANARRPLRKSIAPVPAGLPLIVGVGLTAAAVLLLVGGFVLAGRPGRRARRSGELEAEIQRFRPGHRVEGEAPEAGSATLLRSLLSVTDRLVRARGNAGQIAAELERAGMSLRPHEWMLTRAGVAVGVPILLSLVLPWWLAFPIGVPVGWLLTRFYRSWRAKRRARKFADQLPDSLQLVVGSLRSGFSLPQALDALAREGEAPVATEFGKALSQTRLGVDIADALDSAAERTSSVDLSWASMAIRIQREVGGNLAEVLQTAVETMRERSRLHRHVRALSAEGRLSAWVLILMPIGVGGFMFISRREYMRPLYTDPMGIAMLAFAVLSVSLGAFWMSRLVKVEV